MGKKNVTRHGVRMTKGGPVVVQTKKATGTTSKILKKLTGK